jgi:hypothetical protein
LHVAEINLRQPFIESAAWQLVLHTPINTEFCVCLEIIILLCVFLSDNGTIVLIGRLVFTLFLGLPPSFLMIRIVVIIYKSI